MKIRTFVAVLAFGFCTFLLGRLTAPERGVVIDLSAHEGWIERREDGLVTGEWRAEDGETYRVLVEVLEVQAETTRARSRSLGPLAQK